jgi:uncharacterized protein
VNVVVADACPVIFLAKLNRLALVQGVFAGTILLPETVHRELTQEAIPLHEQRRILEFLAHCRIETVRSPRSPASALSLADHHVLTLAGRHPKSLILTDDSLVRRIALAEGLPVAGTLGILIRAVRAELMTRREALTALEELVTHHQLRVSVDLYQETLRQLRQS